MKTGFEKHIIKQEPGMLFLRLSEQFRRYPIGMTCTIAEINRSGVSIVKTSDVPEVESTSKQIILTDEEMAVLLEGWNRVQHFWNESPLPKRHVLLGCGCIVDWDRLWMEEYDEQGNTIPGTGKPYFDGIPFLYKSTYCPEHEEINVYRFNAEDFAEVIEVQPS